MDLFSLPPIAALLSAAYGALMGIAGILTPVTGAAAAAAAVVLVTLVVRAALIPVGVSQAKADRDRRRLAPKLKALQQRFKNDRERLQRETMKLYGDEKVSPLAGCLPLLIQAPVVGIIYALFLHPTIAGAPNELLGHTLLGVPLGTSLFGALTHGTLDGPTFAVLGGIVLVIAAVGELTRRMLRPPQPVDDSALAATMTRLGGVLQFATAVVALFVPLAAGLYLLVTVAWTLGQRLVLRRVYADVPRQDAGR